MSNEKSVKMKIQGSVWCDDYVDAYLGSENGVAQEIELKRSKRAKGTHLSDKFTIHAACCDVLYFVCWSNHKIVQGFMAQLRGFGGGSIVDSANPVWKVMATGQGGFNEEKRPSIDLINQELGRSGNQWEAPFAGSSNGDLSGKPFSFQVDSGCPDGDPNEGDCIPAHAKFLWHDSGLDPRAKFSEKPYVPFCGFDHNEFLIFKIRAKDIDHKEHFWGPTTCP